MKTLNLQEIMLVNGGDCMGSWTLGGTMIGGALGAGAGFVGGFGFGAAPGFFGGSAAGGSFGSLLGAYVCY